MNDQAIEQEIQAKGLTAPRLTPADIDAAIIGETFTTLPSGKVMICELTLRNGFTVRGEAATVSKANFNVEIGQKISRENARSKVWKLEGYLLQERLASAPKAQPVPSVREQALEELVRSACAIAERKGASTAWDRFAASAAGLGLNGVTARTYRVLPSDVE